jgi:general secretion pathway protein D
VKKYIPFIACFFASSSLLFSQTIEEKISFLEGASLRAEDKTLSIENVNTLLSRYRKELREKYEETHFLVEANAGEEEFHELLQEINEVRADLAKTEEHFRENQVKEIRAENEPYGIWTMDEITISQLVIEYASQDFLYIVPPEVASMKLSIHSALMIPRESWSALLEAIFKQNGIGLKEINAYTKQLYLLKQDFLAVTAVTTRECELKSLDAKTRVAFIYSPNIENLKAAFYFLERFRDPKTTFVYQAGTKIAIVGFRDDIQRLVQLCNNVWEVEDEKITKVITSSKIQPEEITKILKTYFGGLAESNRSLVSMKGGNDLAVLPLVQEGGVVLIGNKKIIERAEAIIRNTESQVDDPFELTVFWYTCSHASPNELSDVLDQVYSSLICSGVEGGESLEQRIGDAPVDVGFPGEVPPPPSGGDSMEGYQNPTTARNWHYTGRKLEDRGPIPQNVEQAHTKKQATFIPHPTTGSVLMVVRKDLLGKIKEVIKKLDIPKRMVEIEVLLCERRLNNTIKSGINLLKIGSNAKNQNLLGVDYEGADTSAKKGIFEFFYSAAKTANLPAFDVTYNFLLSQDDVRVTASPSVITINHVPATIAITDEISISNGASPVDTNGTIIFKESFDRATFGITLTLTPTVHEPEADDQTGQLYVTLENEISFETIKGELRSNYKPDVHKRQVKNQVRIADGQTIILGGLKSRSTEDRTEKIPFLGELPGIGKVFGTWALSDISNEMFIFIKPKVIQDPKRDLLRMREEKLQQRPGDTEYLLAKICDARKKRENARFKRSFELIFGGTGYEECNN